MFSKIMVGVDETPQSRDAAALGEALCRATDADLLLVAAYQDPLLPFPLTFARDVHRARDARATLATARSTWAPSGHTLAVPDFSPARALRRVARDEHVDLLVLGSARDTEPGRVHAGRTGRQVLHDAAGAVVLAVAGRREHEPRLTRIVVGVDESPESADAFETARALARGAGGELVAVGVVDDRLPVDSVPFGEIVELSRWDEIIAERRAHVEALLEERIGADERVTRDVRVGDPVGELAEAARGADLLVVGSRRWGALDRVVIGSTAEELCRRGPCSVMVVPRPAHGSPEDERHAVGSSGRAGGR
ncbi:universal stress protein [Baekduia soli]|uniref:Universal stress protein n=1 Tax=Baekduia soli TaxID=496014 RepID=A0A5B8UB21_9ACTN|nr:universal stress protein [Baekduia soli]QEC49821.1 universal stress protein [Baekduia soli]